MLQPKQSRIIDFKSVRLRSKCDKYDIPAFVRDIDYDLS